MNELKLSRRLERVAHYIPKDAILADIGSDHAYLPCYTVLQGKVEKVVAGEVVEGPFRSAKEQVQKLNLNQNIDVRKGDGLEVIEKCEVNCITICGMGGTLITTILEAGKEKLTNDMRLILQPNIGSEHIRKWLYNEQWEIISEEIIEEDGKIYEIIVAEKGDFEKPYQNISLNAGILLGPLLLKEKNVVFVQKWQSELKHWKNIEAQLKDTINNDRNLSRLNELYEKMNIVKEVLNS